MYEGPDGRACSAGTFPSKRAAQRAAYRQEQLVEEGRWRDRALGATTFVTYVEETWFPSKHLELSTRQGNRSNLDRHFLPYFGHWQMARILPSVVQGWVTMAAADGLSPCSIRKHHTMLHPIFERAVRDQLILTNPCAHTELPKIIKRRSRTLTLAPMSGTWGNHTWRCQKKRETRPGAGGCGQEGRETLFCT